MIAGSDALRSPVGPLQGESLQPLPRFESATVRHHFTVDVEEYFQVSALEGVAPRSEWDGYPSRVADSVDQLLEMLEEAQAPGTFFVLGWVAKRNPALVRRIADCGHEIASHGWGHRRVTTLTPEQFRDSVRSSRAELEDITGVAVRGYRAPSFSICPGREWALDILVEEGYMYDSSLFPVRRRGYGYPGVPRGPFRLRRPAGELIEYPPATLRRLGATLPAGGGGYLRLLPPGLVHAAVRQLGAAGIPGTLYVHPWEIDPGQPRFSVSALTRIRHYGGLARTGGRVRRLLKEFRFTTIASTCSAYE